MPALNAASPPRPADAYDLDVVVNVFAELAVAAGAKIMRIWADKPRAKMKADRSPVCAADEAAETIILRGLAKGRSSEGDRAGNEKEAERVHGWKRNRTLRARRASRRGIFCPWFQTASPTLSR